MAEQETEILKDVDLVTALHHDYDGELSLALVQYLDKAYAYVEEGMGELSTDLQGHLAHFLEAILGAKYLLLEITEDDTQAYKEAL